MSKEVTPPARRAFGPKSWLVDHGTATIAGASRRWAVYSDFAGCHLLVLDGFSACLTPDEMAFIDHQTLPESMDTHHGRTLKVASLMSTPFFPCMAEFKFGGIGYAIHKASIVQPGDFLCFEFIICGANSIDSLDLHFELDGVACRLKTSEAGRIENQNSLSAMVATPCLSLVVNSSSWAISAKIKNSVVAGLSVVCGSYIFAGVTFGHAKASGDLPSIMLHRRAIKPLHPALLVQEDRISEALLRGAFAFFALKEEQSETASKAIGLYIEAANQSSALEARATCACLAVEEILKILPKASKKKRPKFNNEKKRLIEQLVRAGIPELKDVPKKTMAAAVDKLCMVIRSAVADDIADAAEYLSISISSSDADEFVKFRNDLVHRRTLHRESGRSPVGWNRYLHIIDLMDKLFLAFFCNERPQTSRAARLGKS